MTADATRISELLAGVRLVIFDADGTLRRTTVEGQPCPHGDDEWELLPGVRECLTSIDFARSGLAVGVASNQDHVGYGLLDADVARQLLRCMIETATDGAVTEPEIRFCPHRLNVSCQCRKPSPGMLLDIMRSRNIEPNHTIYVGDAPVDAQAAEGAGIRFVSAQEFFATP